MNDIEEGKIYGLIGVPIMRQQSCLTPDQWSFMPNHRRSKKALYIRLHGGKLPFPYQIYCMASALQSTRGVVVKDSSSPGGPSLMHSQIPVLGLHLQGLPEILLLRTTHRGRRTLNTIFLHSNSELSIFPFLTFPPVPRQRVHKTAGPF